jgi:hypothetical protein
MTQLNEEEKKRMPPCVRRCEPGFENEIEKLMELSCSFLKAIGICHSDGDLCEKGLQRPASYRRVKSKSFRP